MASNTRHSRYRLTACTYLPEKKAVGVEFSSSRERVMRRFGFFPRIYLPTGWRERALQTVKGRGARRFEVLKHEQCIEVRAATFDELRRFAACLEAKYGCRTVIPEPERQFLILRNWSYFDCFEVGGGWVERTGCGTGIPNVQMEFLPGTLDMAFGELVKEDADAAQKLAGCIALSNLLCVPPQDAGGLDHAEAFLETVAFGTGIVNENPAGGSAVGFESYRAVDSEKRHMEAAGSIAELDFSGVWAELLTADFMNAGFETLNCKCCMPLGAHEKNVAPNSTAVVEFGADGVYFNSNSSAWANKFHNSVPGKERRVALMREWCLDSIPAGPFERGMRCSVPVADAQRLVADGKAELIEPLQDAVWFCRKRESKLSQAVRRLMQRISCAEKSTQALERGYAKRCGLAYSTALHCSAGYTYLKACAGAMHSVFSSLHRPLLDAESVFFVPELADAVATTHSVITSRFREFSAEAGSRQAIVQPSRVFVDSGEALVLAKRFSAHAGIPMPKVAGGF